MQEIGQLIFLIVAAAIVTAGWQKLTAKSKKKQEGKPAKSFRLKL